MTQDDLNIINSVDLRDKPPGTSTLAWLVAKREAIEASKRQREAKQRLDTYTAQRRQIERRAMTGRKLASPAASASRPAPPPASPHPHLEKLASLSGDAATAYFRTHRSAIVAEDMQRKQAIADQQLSANCRAAKSGRGFNA